MLNSAFISFQKSKFSPFGLFHSLLDFQPIPRRYTDVLSGQDGDLLQELIDHIIRSSCW